MKVEIKHHYGWRPYDVPAETLAQAAYLAVRETHGFLTDDNHTHQANESTTKWGGQDITTTSVLIMRNEKSPPFTGPKWAETSYWIAVQYRAPGAAVVPTVQDLVRAKKEASTVIGVDLAQGTDTSVIAKVDVNQGKATVKVVSSGRLAGKTTAAKKALAKATTQNPDLTIIAQGPAGTVIEKPVKGEVHRVDE